MKATYLFHFTPSLMSAETLEAMFVQREPLAQRLIALIEESVQTQNKHHTLILGPRGIGKTHLVTLITHRVQQETAWQSRLRIAWLREEEWGVDSFLDLLLRIFRALRTEYSTEFPAERVEALYQANTALAQQMAGELLKEFLQDRTLLLIVENLDDLFKGLGDKGQRAFRAFIQENPQFTLLATAQSLFNGISRQTSPFYGFFRVETLPEFSVEDAVQFLKKIADIKQDRALASFLETSPGRARVRTIQHLAGGNPRIYAIFSEFLTRDTLDELVEPFLKTLDELTPYYQARLSHLSTQQRKIVDLLCDRAIPMTVKEIAQRGFMTPQTAANQLGDLRDKGYVYPDPLGPTGRETYYELREPVMRLCLEVKKSRSGPIRLLVEFLRLWYFLPELKERLETGQPDAVLETRERFDKTSSLSYGVHSEWANVISGSFAVLSDRPYEKRKFEDWFVAWKEVAQDREEFVRPLRLMEAALRYHSSRDKRILLELPVEERNLIVSELGA